MPTEQWRHKQDANTIIACRRGQIARRSFQLVRQSSNIITAHIRGHHARSNLDVARFAACRLAAHWKGRIARKRLAKEQSAATVIEAHSRRHYKHKIFQSKMCVAITVQSMHRGNVARRIASEKAWYRNEQRQNKAAFELVESMIAQHEGPTTAPLIARSFLSEDFVDVVDLPGSKATRHGTKEYLSHALASPPPPEEQVMVPLWFTSSMYSGIHEINCLEREVLVAEQHLRVEYRVRHLPRKVGGPTEAQICRRRTSLAANMQDDEQEGKPIHVATLRDEFAKLDTDGSGSLSVDHIVHATALVGLRMEARELRQQLAVGKDAFELSELDAVLKEDRRLEKIGVQRSNRPLLFDVLPLVASTFKMHKTVAQCIDSAVEREASLAREQEVREVRAAETRQFKASMNMAEVRHAVQTLGPVANDGEPATAGNVRSATDRSTEELANLVDEIELLASIEGMSQNVMNLYEGLDLACAECIQQRKKLRPLMGTQYSAKAMRLAGRTKKPQEKPRRTLTLAPIRTAAEMNTGAGRPRRLPKSSSEPAMPRRPAALSLRSHGQL